MQTLEVVHDVNDKVEAVKSSLTDVEIDVKGINDRLNTVTNGAPSTLTARILISLSAITWSDGKEMRMIMQQTANSIHDIKCLRPILSALCGVPNVLSGNYVRESLKIWVFSSSQPPDPSINHNIACDSHHEGTAIWFFQGSIFGEWTAGGSKSLLWIYGKRVS